MLSDARLYGILDLGYVAGADALAMADRMLAGGVDVLQLRAKKASEAEILALGRALAPRCREAGVPFILNDFPHLVSETGADGAHIGQDDGPLEAARAAAGPGAIIGRSTHSLAQAPGGVGRGCGLHWFRPALRDADEARLHADRHEDIATVFRESPVPVFCIGGIKRENLPAVVVAGARRVVVVSGILLATDVAGYIADCKDALDA